jgi:hypothetical protein
MSKGIPYDPQDWVAQTSIKFKHQLKLYWHLKSTWNVHEINLQLRFNWYFNLIEVHANQSRLLHINYQEKDLRL